MHVTKYIFSGSDREPVANWEVKGPLSEHRLAPSPTPLTNEGVESGGVANHTHLAQLYQLVIDQQKEIASLRAEQRNGFAVLHQQLESVQRSMMDEHRSTLGDHAREQRILLPHVLHAELEFT